MVNVTYRGDATSVEWHGMTFPHGQSVKVDDAVAKDMKPNPFFDIGSDKADAPNNEKLEARHKGGRFFGVYRGDAELAGNLSKDEADAFNRLSDDDKAKSRHLSADAA